MTTAEFAVADIEEIQWSSDPFNCLVIPEDDREVIMALVEARNRHIGQEPVSEFDDVVAGKGRGLNILLQYGSPLSLGLHALIYQVEILDSGKL